MKTTLLGLLAIAASIMLTSCETPPEGTDVVIETDLGNIYIELFDDTPQHRDNFLKLAREGFFDGTNFHRVVKQFMIQGGDPFSRDPAKADSVGMGGPGYTLPHEIRRHHLHFAGALSAARTSDEANPLRESSGSQFYIVTGRTIPAEQMQQMQQAVREGQLQGFRALYVNRVEVAPLRNQLDSLGAELQKMQLAILGPNPMNPREANQKLAANAPFVAKYNQFQALLDSLSNMADRAFATEDTTFEYTPAEIQNYQTVGGAPFLDMQYTVFGRVIKGMEIVTQIENAPSAPPTQNDPRGERPANPVIMRRVRVVE